MTTPEFFFSRAIATYLCNQYEKGDDKTRLYPVNPKARAIVDQVLYASESNEVSILFDYLVSKKKKTSVDRFSNPDKNFPSKTQLKKVMKIHAE